MNFYPRPPRGGRHAHASPEMQELMISIHALREEGDNLRSSSTFRAAISIHALREEGDCTRWKPTCTAHYFYPRPPRGGRQFGVREEWLRTGFLSTPSARRATAPISIDSTIRAFLSTPSARRATRWTISKIRWTKRFLSTPSARRATPAVPATRSASSYFYPRPPRGGRHGRNFQGIRFDISIHALREEGDAGGFSAPSTNILFLSTPSARRATLQVHSVR